MFLERAFGIVFACILGLVWGSFANVIAIRWHEESSLWGRSMCPGCKRELRPRHLVPVFSWLWLKGKCADCAKKIHVQYPLVEAVCGILGIIAATRFDPLGAESVRFLFEFVISMGLIVPVVMDLRWKEVPVEYLGGLAAVIFGFQFFSGVGIVPLILAVLVPVSFFGFQYVVSKGRWIGAGDLWIGAVMGAVAGRPALAFVALYFSYILGGGAALIGAILGIYRRGDRLPFAPALAVGTLFMMWFGERALLLLSQSYV